MKVVLIHPPHPNSTDDRLDAPMGLLYIASHLEKNKVDVEIADLSGLTEWNIPFADVYGITAYVATLNITKEIVAKCRVRNPDAIVVIGGAHATARPDDFWYAEKVVRGHGEAPMLEISTGKKSEVDLFEFPAYHLVDLNSYSRRIDDKQSLTFLTSRGCPFKCTFCGLASMHNSCGFKMMQAKTAVEQLSRIKSDFGIDRINFQDDIFTMNKARLFEILESIKSLNIRFRCMGRAGYDTEEVYKRLAEAGCDQVAWGIESGSQLLLDRMKKQVTVEDNKNVIKWAKKYGITSRAFFMIGFPGETAQTIEETRRFIDETDPDQYFVSNFVPYPGTDVGDNPSKYGITFISNDYDQYYQVSKDGTGGITIDTEWLSRSEFRELEINFRNWLKNRQMRGKVQDYERKMAC